ncbi:hypothetical protein [Streptomyces indicus]|uniref:Uncharacterized protein n=1 Tax=Streptomyces indicus TaxID=417292 RepID=A0A1G9BRT4_9ACTN|nr:hypothetical protein [Streptomyces indicus]SDK41874.1 hypothetical protein SAMN05421806_107196 [Streptomyces indicus]
MAPGRAVMLCAYCRREIVCGRPALGGPPCPGQFHVHSNEAACFPEQGAASPRAWPPGGCGCKPRELRQRVTGPPPAPRAGTEQLAETGKAFLGLAPGARVNVVELPDGRGVCVVQTGRGGGKAYVAPDRTVLFVPSGTDFDTGLAAFLGGARTPAKDSEART